MKDRARTEKTPVHHTSIPIGLNKFELLAAVLTAAAAIAVVVYYFVSLRPLQSRVDDARSRLAAQQKVITQAKDHPIKDDSNKKQIELAKASLNDFEGHELRPIIGGRIEVINLLNAMVKDDKLRMGSALDMHLGRKIQVLSETSSGNDQSRAGDSRNNDSGSKESSNSESRGSDSERGSRSSQNKKSDPFDIFPKVQFRFTVSGHYDDLRKLVKDLQNTKDFLVVDSIALATAEGKSGHSLRGAGNGGGVAGGIPGGIELTVTLTAYFRPDQPVSAAE
jgi:hypothetical protein